MGRCERRCMPEPRPAGAIADRAKDIEGDRSSGYPPAARILGPDPKGQVVEQQRALSGPCGRPVRLEDHRREQLDPIANELAMGGLTHFTGLRVKTEAPGAIASHPRGPHVAAAGTDRRQRFGDPAGDELVMARSLRTLASLDPPLAVVAGAMPRLLPRKQLGEDVRLGAPG